MEGYLIAKKPKAPVSMDLEGGDREKCPIQAHEGSYPWKGLCPANKEGMIRVDRVSSCSRLQNCIALAVSLGRELLSKLSSQS